MKNDSVFAYENWVLRRYPTNSGTHQEIADPSFFVDLQIVFQDPTQFKAEEFFNYPIELILSYLKHTHIFYTTSYLEEMDMAIDRLSESSPSHKEIKPALKTFFRRLKTQLVSHIEEEEKYLYPYIEALSEAKRTGALVYSVADKIELIDFLMSHDDQIEKGLYQLVQRLDKMLSDQQDSFAFRMMVSKLSLFELDLRIHGWMEELVLVPMAIDLEKKILST